MNTIGVIFACIGVLATGIFVLWCIYSVVTWKDEVNRFITSIRGDLSYEVSRFETFRDRLNRVEGRTLLLETRHNVGTGAKN